MGESSWHTISVPNVIARLRGNGRVKPGRLKRRFRTCRSGTIFLFLRDPNILDIDEQTGILASCPNLRHSSYISSPTTYSKLGEMLPSVRPFSRSVCSIFSRAASSLTPKGRAQILEKKPDDVVITFAKRTAVGRAKKGQLKNTPVDEMLYTLFKVCSDSRAFNPRNLFISQSTFERIRLDPSKIDDICVGKSFPLFIPFSAHLIFSGTCHPPSPLYVSRAAAIAAGIPYQVPISIVNRLCSSGLMAIRHIAQGIKVGEASLGVAIGVESMSLK